MIDCLSQLSLGSSFQNSLLELSLCACAEVANSTSTSKAAAAVAKVATPAVNQERCFSSIFLYILRYCYVHFLMYSDVTVVRDSPTGRNDQLEEFIRFSINRCNVYPFVQIV